MAERKFVVRLSWIYVGGLVVVSLLTCGVGGVIGWWWIRSHVPWFIDEEGISFRDGRRFLLKDLSKGKQIDVIGEESKERLSGMLDLHFGKQVVRLDPLAIDDPVGAIDFVKSVLQ